VLIRLLAIAALAGCSFLTVRSPPPHDVKLLHPMAPPSCTTSSAAPVVDALLAGTAFVMGASLSGREDSDDGGDEHYPDINLADEASTALLVSGLVVAVSSAYGFWQTSQCRALTTLAAPRLPNTYSSSSLSLPRRSMFAARPSSL
jgi:hypothetical protein